MVYAGDKIPKITGKNVELASTNIQGLFPALVLHEIMEQVINVSSCKPDLLKGEFNTRCVGIPVAEVTPPALEEQSAPSQDLAFSQVG